MPIGVGATTLANDPRAQGVKFVTDPIAFFELTEKQQYTAFSFDTPGSGSTERRQLPQANILSRIRLVFNGVITTTLGAGTVTTTSRWPYGFLDQCTFSANAQNDLISVSGDDLHARRSVNHPGYVPNDDVDVIAGGVGAGQLLANAANTVLLSWELPVAIDMTSLIGSVYAQSPAMNLTLALRQAVTTDLLVAAGGATIDSVVGTWYVEVTNFEIPLGAGDTPALIVPDLTRLHGLNSFEVPYVNTGEVQAPMIRVPGQLDRLFFQVSKANPDGNIADQFLSMTLDAAEILGVRLEYGASQRPLNYDPAQFLAIQNLLDYSDSLPNKWGVLDFLAENAPRDVVMMPGVTDLKLVATIGAVAPVAGASVRIMQETLFQ